MKSTTRTVVDYTSRQSVVAIRFNFATFLVRCHKVKPRENKRQSRDYERNDRLPYQLVSYLTSASLQGIAASDKNHGTPSRIIRRSSRPMSGNRSGYGRSALSGQ